LRQLTKGANVALAELTEQPDSITLSLRWTNPTGQGDADVSVLLLGADRKVRTDEDFFFYNRQPGEQDPVQLLGKTPTEGGVEDTVTVDLTAVPGDISAVIVAASRYENARFGDLEDVHLQLSDGAGRPVARFDITDLDSEAALMFAELYRRDDRWKVRAVGQGYRGGLADLATDFGVRIDDEPETPAEPAPAPKRAAKVRTVKKKTIPARAALSRLADHESWRPAQLFPICSSRNSQEQETRSTAMLLAVMANVPEFGRRLAAKVNAPAGAVETFTEVSFKHADEQVRPDGVIKVARGGRVWTALVETKTAGNPLRPTQVESYVEVARRQGYEAVVTVSNDLALHGEHPVSIDRRRLGKVALRHLSWAEIRYEAHLLCHHEGFVNPAHLWLMTEFLRYLRHDNSGCQGFDNMGPAWVAVRDAVVDRTLHPTDKRAAQVAESWEKAIRQLCLRLGGDLGVAVAPVLWWKAADAAARRAKVAATLAETGQLEARIRVPGPAQTVEILADLRAGRVEASAQVAAPELARSLTRVKWLTRQLDAAPADLRVETLLKGRQKGPRELLKQLHAEPALLVPDDPAATITGFRLTLAMKLGTKRGSTRGVDQLVDDLFTGIVQRIKPVQDAPVR
jgi:stress response protein SCP2